MNSNGLVLKQGKYVSAVIQSPKIWIFESEIPHVARAYTVWCSLQKYRIQIKAKLRCMQGGWRLFQA
ncbi:hypothetical protein [Mesorhizobium kowhaii]|uniref:hypothetical protein n=1 Tax=Mesorhizobium kowhaii TaxID=1300272 RepID=UPI00142D3597|nr:hypothetical protein [Mesorhizobium kowhaii]